MRSVLAKSLYIGLAALSLGGVAVATTTATAQAASKKPATIVSKEALGKDAKSVEVTGMNAIYTKPGTVKGAKRVASKAQVKKLANSKRSADTFHAYHMAVTNRGTVYYKIVSMNGKYRGYIYGGRVKGAMVAGIRTTKTVTSATMPTRMTGFRLKNVDKNTLWTAPKNTEYKAHKVSLYGVGKDDTFKVSKAEKKTKEGTLYYYVTDEKNAAVSGWIYAGDGYKDATTTEFGGLTLKLSEAAATNDNSVRVIYRDASSKKEVGTSTWITKAEKTHAGDKVNPTVAAVTPDTPAGDKTPAPAQPSKPAENKMAKAATSDAPTNVAGVTLSKFITGNVPAGYRVAKTVNADTLANAATYGNNVYVDVTASATSKVVLTAEKVVNKIGDKDIKVTNGLKDNTKLKASDMSLSISSAAKDLLTGNKGIVFSSDDLTAIAKGIGTKVENAENSAVGTKTYFDANAKAYHYVFTLNVSAFPNDNRHAVAGDDLSATFTAQLIEGSVQGATNDNSWIVTK